MRYKQAAFGDLHNMSQTFEKKDMIEWNKINWSTEWRDGWTDETDEWMKWNETKWKETKWNETMNGRTNEWINEISLNIIVSGIF